MSTEQPVFASDNEGADGVLGPVVVGSYMAFFQISNQLLPVVKSIAQGFPRSPLGGVRLTRSSIQALNSSSMGLHFSFREHLDLIARKMPGNFFYLVDSANIIKGDLRTSGLLRSLRPGIDHLHKISARVRTKQPTRTMPEFLSSNWS